MKTRNDQIDADVSRGKLMLIGWLATTIVVLIAIMLGRKVFRHN